MKQMDEKKSTHTPTVAELEEAFDVAMEDLDAIIANLEGILTWFEDEENDE